MKTQATALTVLAVALLLTKGLAIAADSPLYSRWVTQSRSAIARIHDPKVRAATTRSLDATIARVQAERAGPAPRVDPRLAAQRELAAKRYRLEAMHVRPRAKSWWEMFWDWVGARWDALRDAIFRKVKIGPAGQVAIGDALIAIVAGLLLFTIFRILVNLQIDRSRRAIDVRRLEAPRNAHALYLQASALARDGRFADALRTLFLATVVALDLRGIIRDDASATVNEMRRELQARDASMVGNYDDVAGGFVAAAYAERPVAQPDWERASVAYRRLVRTEGTT